MGQKSEKISTARKLLYGFLIIIFLLILTPLILLYSISEPSALVAKNAQVSASSLGNSRKLLKEIYTNLKSERPGVYQTIFSNTEINGLIGFVSRASHRITGRANLTEGRMLAAFSLHMPENPFGEYINILVTLVSSRNGLNIEEVKIGALTIKGSTALYICESLLNRVLAGEEQGSVMLNAIQSVQVTNANVLVSYSSVSNFKHILDDTLAHAKSLRDEYQILANPKKVRPYYLELCKFHQKNHDKTSLGSYISKALYLAQTNTNKGGNAVEENRSAILALAILVGTYQFDSVIGALKSGEYESCENIKKPVLLANRKDLRLHFIFSAAIKMLSDSGVSFAVGEAKEMLDSIEGGTGFSFADLAADKAGIRFAEVAIDERLAQQLQKNADRFTSERYFFPDISGLREGIPEHEFKRDGGIEGDYYQTQLRIINQRIDTLSLFSQS